MIGKGKIGRTYNEEERKIFTVTKYYIMEDTGKKKHRNKSHLMVESKK